MEEYLRIGKVINTRGLSGEVKVLPLTDDMNRFDFLKSVILEEDEKKLLNIEKVSYHKNFVYIRFNEIKDIESAQELKGKYLLVDRKNAVKLKENQYFICDLIGLKVYEKDVFLGNIADVLQTGANDVYIVKRDRDEILIPAIKDVVLCVNIVEGYMEVKLPDGLYNDEIC